METYICIDIGTSSIKAVEKTGDGQAIRWGILERRSRPFHTSIQPIDLEDTAKHLKMLIERMRSFDGLGEYYDKMPAVASVPAFLALTALAGSNDPRALPAVPGTYHSAAVEIDWGRYFLAAIPNDVVEKYAKIFHLAGLRLEKIELESASLARTLAADPGRSLIIDVGDRSTTLTVAQGGAVRYFEQTDFAMASGVWDVIIKKAEKIAAAHETKKNILCGGGAALLNLKAFVAANSALAICNGLQR